MIGVHLLQESKVHPIIPVFLVRLEFLDLEIDEAIPDFSHRRKILVVHVEQVKDHPSIGRRDLLGPILSPVEAEPLKVRRVKRDHRHVSSEGINEIWIVPCAEAWPLPLVLLSSLDVGRFLARLTGRQCQIQKV